MATAGRKNTMTRSKTRIPGDEFVMHDELLGRHSVFRPRRKGTKSQRERTDILVEGWDDPVYGKVDLEIYAPYPVDSVDEDLFLAILREAGMIPPDERLVAEAGSPEGLDAASKVRASAETVGARRLRLTTTLHRLLGGDGGGYQYKQARASLKRLSAIGYMLTGLDGNKQFQESGEGLLWHHVTESGDLEIVLSERLTRAIMGIRDKDTGKESRHFARVSLSERAVLTGEVAKILHRWLSCRLTRRGHQMFPTHIETLYAVVFGDDPAPDGTVRRRKTDIRKAIAQIDGLPGWKAIVTADDKVKAIRLEG